ncbi:MAG: hypothetical protein KCHDKBKB_00925 [Elusimicrobia bacterium]|nr:hypothetical protein [Elusimicrobiota bacterium]
MKKGALLFPLLLSFSSVQSSLVSDSPDEAVQKIEVIVQKKKAKPQEIKDLIAALQHTDTSIRVKERAAWALGELEAKSAVSALIEATQHKGLLVRSAAVHALIHLRSQAALPSLVRIAESDPILSMRQDATLALGLLQTEKAIPPLVKLSEDPNPEIRGASVLAMASLHSKKNNFSQIFEEMSADASPYVQERVKRGWDVAKRSNGKVMAHLEATDVDVRLFAALYFQRHGGSKDLKSLETFKNSEADEETRDQLKKSITAIKKRSAAKAIEQKAAPPKPKPTAPTEK